MSAEGQREEEVAVAGGVRRRTACGFEIDQVRWKRRVVVVEEEVGKRGKRRKERSRCLESWRGGG